MQCISTREDIVLHALIIELGVVVLSAKICDNARSQATARRRKADVALNSRAKDVPVMVISTVLIMKGEGGRKSVEYLLLYSKVNELHVVINDFNYWTTKASEGKRSPLIWPVSKIAWRDTKGLSYLLSSE